MIHRFKRNKIGLTLMLVVLSSGTIVSAGTTKWNLTSNTWVTSFTEEYHNKRSVVNNNYP